MYPTSFLTPNIVGSDSFPVKFVERDTSRLTVENKELKLRLQAMESKEQIMEARRKAMRNYVEVAARRIPQPPQYPSSLPVFHDYSTGQTHLLEYVSVTNLLSDSQGSDLDLDLSPGLDPGLDLDPDLGLDPGPGPVPRLSTGWLSETLDDFT